MQIGWKVLLDACTPVCLAMLCNKKEKSFCCVNYNNVIDWIKRPFLFQELLNSLHDRYEEWLIKKNFYIPAPVVVSFLLYACTYSLTYCKRPPKISNPGGHLQVSLDHVGSKVFLFLISTRWLQWDFFKIF